MALPLKNEFCAQTDEAAITAANSATGTNAFDSVTLDSTNTVKFDSGNKARGGMACRVDIATSGRAMLTWTSGSVGTLTEIWGRLYYWNAGHPVDNGLRLVGLYTSSTTRVASIELSTIGKLRVVDSVSATDDSVAAIPTEEWIRIEFHVLCSATVGILEAQMYALDSLTPITNGTVTSPSTRNTGTSLDAVGFGQNANVAGINTFWIDDVEVNETDYPGPSTAGQIFDWTSRDPQIAGVQVSTVKWSADESQFVVVGSNGDISTSPTGETWTPRATDTNITTHLIRGLAYSPSLDIWVIGAQNSTVESSTDGATWTNRTGQTLGALNDCEWSESQGLFVMTSDAAVAAGIEYSSNGTTWTLNASGLPTISFVGIAYSPSLDLWVIVGNNAGSAAIYTATDPTGTWTSRTSAQPDFLNTVGWSDDLGMFVAGGGFGQMQYSTNGTSWSDCSKVPLGTASNDGITKVFWVGGTVQKWLAGGTANRLLTSDDGDIWIHEDPAPSTVTWRGMSYGSGKVVVAGASNIMYTGEIPAPPITDQPEIIMVGRSGARW